MSEHESSLAGKAMSAEFEQYLQSLPWAPSRLDWREIEHSTFKLEDGWEAWIDQFAQSVPAGRHDYLMFMYSGSEPSLIARREDGLRDVDLIYSASAGARYFCGVDKVRDEFVVQHADFGEFDGVSSVLFRR